MREKRLWILTILLIWIAMVSEAIAQNSYSGTATGTAFTTVNDGNGNATVQLFIVGIKVELKKKDSLGDTTLAEGYTTEGGQFNLQFNDTDNANTISLYLKFTAENEDGSIRVREKFGVTKITRTEKVFETNPAVITPGANAAVNFGQFSLNSNSLKPQLLHWAIRSKKFVEEETAGHFSFPHPASPDGVLDILTVPLGTTNATAFFFPGGYQTELILSLVTLFGTGGSSAISLIFPKLALLLKGTPVPAVVITTYINTEFSDKDAVYIGTQNQLDENTLYHEFGHYLMWHLQGESWIDLIDASFSRHWIQGNNKNSKLSWTEGFASGFSFIVDAWARNDDNEYRTYSSMEYEDRLQNLLETLPSIINCAGAGITCNNQSLSHGFVSEWYVATTIYDLWDGSNNLQLNGNSAPTACDYFDANCTTGGVLVAATCDTSGNLTCNGTSSGWTINDDVELSFLDIIRPILENGGTGGFHSLLNNQEQYLLNNFVQYHQELIGLTFTAPLDDLQECQISRDITGVFHYNGIRNLHSSLGTNTFPAFLFRDFLNTDEIYFYRDVETEFYSTTNGINWVPEETVFQNFQVDVTELADSRDKYNFGNTGSFSGELSDDLLVNGTAANGSATMFFNKSGRNGWRSAQNNFNMPVGTQFTTGDEYYVSLCGSMTLDARNGGTIMIGDASTQPETTVTLESGSTLILGGGYSGAVLEREFLPNGPYVSKGKLFIHANSRLVVEQGANLIINPGAEITLNGTDAVLEIRGNLIINQGGNFTYTSAGGGYALFDLPNNSGAPNVTMNNSSRFTLEEVPFTVAFDSYIYPTDNSNLQFTIFESVGTFESNAYINVANAYFTMMQSTILANGSAHHKGIIVNGAQHQIVNNEINGGDPGISANNSRGNLVLTVVATDFIGGKTGIRTVYLPLYVQGGSFSGIEYGIHATDAIVSVNNAEFSSCGAGMFTVRGQVLMSGADFNSCGTGWYGTEFINPAFVTNTDFIGGSISVRVDGASTLRAITSTFSGALYGIELANGAILNIQNSASNEFRGSSSAIYLNQAGVPLMNQGYNEFYKDFANPMAPTISGSINNTGACPVAGIATSMNAYFYSFNPATGTWLSTDLASSPYSITAVNGGCAYTLLP